MIKVGLTGGIGSGKTYVASFFRQLNIPVYNSDMRAKTLMNTSNEIKKKLVQLFGADIYNKNELNRQKIAQIIFNDKQKLEQVNSIVHPVVQADFEHWVTEHSQSKYILKEAAILIESGAYNQLDKIIVVYAPDPLRVKRVMQRDGMTEDQVKARINKQMPQEEKLSYADFVITNDGTQIVKEQVAKIHQQIIQQYK